MKLSELLRRVDTRTATKSQYKECKRRSDLLGFSLLVNKVVLSYLATNGLESAYNAMHYQSCDKLALK